MKQIIWIYGTSAAGKETFIKSLISNADLRQKVDIDEGFVISDGSLINLGKLDGSRESIIEEVSTLIERNSTVVVKWQYGDTLLDSPNRLRIRLPTMTHRVINLNVGQNEQIRRLKTKSWWRDSGSEGAFISHELQLVYESLLKLEPDINVLQYDW